MMEAKLQQRIDINKHLIAGTIERLEKGRQIIAKANQPKLTPELFDWQTNEKGVTVSYYLGNTEKEKFFSFDQIYTFIGDFYNTIVDRFDNGEHTQYVDNQSAEDYFNENTSDVLTDFLKNAKI